MAGGQGKIKAIPPKRGLATTNSQRVREQLQNQRKLQSKNRAKTAVFFGATTVDDWMTNVLWQKLINATSLSVRLDRLDSGLR